MGFLTLFDSDYGVKASRDWEQRFGPGQVFPLDIRGIGPIDFLRFLRSKGGTKSLSGVIFHGISSRALLLLLLIPRRIPIWWVGLGYDYYDLLEGYAATLFLLRTKLAKKEIERTGLFTRRPFLLRRLKDLVLDKLVDSRLYRFTKAELLRRRKVYFSPGLESEFELLPTRLRQEFVHVRWTYGVMLQRLSEAPLPSLGDELRSGAVIGNSATFENNHFDILHSLRTQGYSGKIIVPMTYGSELCIAALNSYTRKLDLNLELMTASISKEQLESMFRSKEFLLMANLRQQGGTTIKLAFLCGMSVYMSSRSPFWRYFSDLGFRVGVIEDILSFNGTDPTLEKWKFEQSDKLMNQALAIKHFSTLGDEYLISEDNLSRMLTQKWNRSK